MDGMFGTPKHIAALIVAKQKPGKDDEGEDGDGEAIPEVKMAMEDFLDAADKKDAEGMAQAFEAAFRALEMEPHDEEAEQDEG